jgi:TIR domain
MTDLPDWDLGAGRTLHDLNYVDLFGEDYAEQAVALVTTINRVIGEKNPDLTVRAAADNAAAADRPQTRRPVSNEPTPARCGVFVNYRRNDTGWAAKLLAEALRRRLGSSSEVFLDTRSIQLGQAFSEALMDGVRRSAVLVVLIGPRWDEPPLVQRLTDPRDWVRREVLAARDLGTTVVPVLVDRGTVPAEESLPKELRFLRGLQATWVWQNNDRDDDLFAEQIVGLLPTGCGETTAQSTEGVECKRAALEPFLRHILPPVQQWMGNRDRLLELALAVLGRNDRLIFLAPATLDHGQRAAATVFLTSSDVVVVEVDNKSLIAGEIRFPRTLVQRAEVVPTMPGFAAVVVHTTAGDTVRLHGLLRDQARQIADRLRP